MHIKKILSISNNVNPFYLSYRSFKKKRPFNDYQMSTIDFRLISIKGGFSGIIQGM